VRPLPPKPETPAELAAQDAAAAPPASKRPSKKSGRKTAAADPGPPPPLPPDLVIPPKPPLPPMEDATPAVQGAAPPVAAAAPPVEDPTAEEAASEAVEPPGAAAAAAPDQPPAPVETAATEEPPAPGETAVTLDDEEPVILPVEPAPVVVAAAPAETAVKAAPVVVQDPVALPAKPDVLPPVAQRRRSEVATEPQVMSAAAAASATEAVPEVFVAASLDPSTAALVVKGVTKAFGETRAVDGIDLTVPAGIFYGLVGPNGAGKTTTLSMIAGLLRPDRGAIRVNGVDAVADPLHAKRQMGVLPDRLRTFDRLTGRQLLHYYGVLRGLPSAVVESRTNDLARAFDLSDALGRVVSDYSAGMVKKVMLAGAMIHSPRLLVLDEPFEAVDPVSSAIILDILKTYVAHGGTVILSSHGMDLVERVCTRVAVMVAGQVLAEGTVDEVRGELTLEQRFIELAGGLSDVEGLEWLHTFSD
jgi:ABC-2 type transport system ATP-binding protein